MAETVLARDAEFALHARRRGRLAVEAPLAPHALEGDARLAGDAPLTTPALAGVADLAQLADLASRALAGVARLLAGVADLAGRAVVRITFFASDAHLAGRAGHVSSQ